MVRATGGDTGDSGLSRTCPRTVGCGEARRSATSANPPRARALTTAGDAVVPTDATTRRVERMPPLEPAQATLT